MSRSSKDRFTLAGLRQARAAGQKVAMLTCYDYSTARLMSEAGVPAILVGDSAASVILGYPTTLPVSLEFMIEITAAVRRGAPNALLVADMPFGSYQASIEQGVRNVCAMVQRTGCDCVKLELDSYHLPLVQALSAAGIAVMGHIGLRPQAVGMLGGYRTQGRTAAEARRIVSLAQDLVAGGAAALLIEAVPPEVSAAVVQRVEVPVIGCGAGPDCHGHVVVVHDAVGLSVSRPKFVPELANLAEPLKQAFVAYVQKVAGGTYPSAEYNYSMPAGELAELRRLLA